MENYLLHGSLWLRDNLKLASFQRMPSALYHLLLFIFRIYTPPNPWRALLSRQYCKTPAEFLWAEENSWKTFPTTWITELLKRTLRIGFWSNSCTNTSTLSTDKNPCFSWPTAIWWFLGQYPDESVKQQQQCFDSCILCWLKSCSVLLSLVVGTLWGSFVYIYTSLSTPR